MSTNTIIYQAVWENKLAQRLDKPQNWKEVNDVRYSDAQTYNFPLVSTSNEPAVATLTNTAAGRSTLSNIIPFIGVTETNETLSIITAEIDSVYMDYADQAQSNYAKLADMGTLLGKKMGERLESISLGNFANWTAMGDDGTGAVGLSSTALTISANNVDDVVRAVVEQIYTANGADIFSSNGGFVVWRPADWTKLVTYMQANGYRFADVALQDGGTSMVGKDTMGLFHYMSTLNTAGHLMAGVRGVQKLGILNGTFGKTYVNEMPSSSTAGSLSGTQIHTRVDYGMLVPTNLKPVIYNIVVN